MQTTWQDNNWFENNSSIKRQFASFIVSVTIVALLMLIPIKGHFEFDEQPPAFQIQLVKPEPKLAIEPEIVKPIEKKIVDNPKPKVEIVEKIVKPVSKKETTIIPVLNPRILKPKVLLKKEVKPIIKQPSLPSSGVIFNSAYGKVKLQELDKDFQARTGNEDDFKFKEFKEADWNKVTKYLDEEIDKPRYDMKFYSMGIEGKIEKFVDKITYKKRFVTRYGTKIDCVLVGIIVMCGWK